MKELLKRLCAIDGVSGDEGDVCAAIREMIEGYAENIHTDRQGNLCAFRRGVSQEKTRMICAHMDEVGFIITNIDDKGFLSISPVGGIDLRVAMGRQLHIKGKNGVVNAITGLTPIHLAEDDERKQTPKQLYADIGAKDRADAETVVSIGDFASFVTAPADFGIGMLKAKAIDDRFGCAAMIDLLRSGVECAYDTWFVFTVREEVGGAGAKAAAFALDPAEALVLEGTTAADVSGVSGEKRVCCAGKGPVISYMDRSAIYDPKGFRALCAAAKELEIPYQTKMMVAGGTDAGSITVSRGGIPCVGISAPVRYLHAPSSVVAWSDCEAARRLAEYWLRTK